MTEPHGDPKASRWEIVPSSRPVLRVWPYACRRAWAREGGTNGTDGQRTVAGAVWPFAARVTTEALVHFNPGPARQAMMSAGATVTSKSHAR